MGMIPPTKGMILPIDGGGEAITFQWNPDKIVQSKSAKWARQPVAGREQPVLQYGCGQARQWKIEFDLSRSNQGDSFVKSMVESCESLAMPSGGGKVKHPPRVRFRLGNGIKAKCIVEDVSITYGPLFNPMSLLPYDARVAMTLTEYK